MSSTFRQSPRARLVVLGSAVAALVVAAVTSAPWPGSRAGAQTNEPAEEISRGPGGGGPFSPFNTDASISADGRFVVFNASPAGAPDFVAIRDRIGDTTAPVPYAGVGPVPDSANPTISDDGCVIAFSANVINGEFGGYQWVVHDRCRGVSAIPMFLYSPNPFPPPAVSADGSVIAWSNGSNIYVFARSGNVWNAVGTVIGGPFAGPPLYVGGEVSISDDGDLLAFRVGPGSPYFPSPSNIALLSRSNPVVTPITTSGVAYGPSLSGDGSLVAFYQYDGATQNNVWVYDRPAAASRLVAQDAGDPAISRDGRHIAYNLEEGEIGDIYVATSTSAQPFATVATDLVSYSTAGPPSTTQGSASSPAISDRGRWVAFHSYAGSLLSDEPAFFAGWHVYARQRRPVLTVSPINFGSVQVGTSFNLTSTITNQGLSGFVVTSIAASGGGFTVVGENCPDVLNRGDSCTVTVRFAPGAVGPHNGQLTVRDDTFPPAPLGYSGALTGTGSAIPVVTTIPPTVPPTSPAVTTVPSVPVPLSLTIDPPTVAFDPTTVGLPAATQSARVRNDGTTPNTVASVSISGTHATDFEIVQTDCTGAVLAPNATCDVELEFTPGDAGDRAGQLDAAGAGGSSASATLRGSALYAPTLVAFPAVASPGQVTTLIGDGFPPSSPIELVWDLTPDVFAVTSDASGSFKLPALILGHTLLGPQVVSAVAQPGVFEQVDTDLLVVPGTVQPQATTGLVQFVTNHVSRG